MSDLPQAAPAGKRARTRMRLIEAAIKTIGEKGFYAATLDDIAAEAGLTKGAIYGNFKTKEELFLAILELPTQGVRPVFRSGASLKEQLRRFGEGVVAFLPAAAKRGVLFSEFQRYIQTHPEFRAKIDEQNREMVRRAAGRLSPYFSEAEIGMPLERFIVILDALIDGLIAQRLATPSAVPDDLIVAAFERLG